MAAVVEALEARRLLSTYTVTNANDSGAGSLRQAMLDASRHAGADVIQFAVGSGGAKTISPRSPLPDLGDGTVLDATTQPGFAGKPLISLSGSGAGASTDGLRITRGGGVVVRGLAIKNFGGSGILIAGSGGNRIAANYVGTDGSYDNGNKAHGILVQSPDNLIGGYARADRNVISGNGLSGVFLYTAAAARNAVVGNFIGTDAAGARSIANAKNGVQINGAAGNWVGATKQGARNVISGNGNDGVLIVSAGATLNVVQGNFIGTDATGSKRLGNGWYGVEVSQADNVVGGAARGARNVVTANVYGGVVMYLSSAHGNRIQGNFIGTDCTGTKDLGNVVRGLEFTNGAHDNLAGGSKFSQRNVISGNDGGGVGFYSNSAMNLLYGNYVGTSADGAHALGNTGAGVMVTDHAGTNLVGGRYRLGNVISANSKEGIFLGADTAGTIVHGNKVGTDAGGTLDLGNASDGIYVTSAANQIGGRKRGMGNLVSGNGGNGIYLNGATGNYVGRNLVGVDGSGRRKLANAKTGIVVANTRITTVRDNVVAFNGGYGVKVSAGGDNPVVRNSVYSNLGPEIDLG
jgi:titin